VIDATIALTTDHSLLFRNLLLLVDFYGALERIPAVIVNKMDCFDPKFQLENFKLIEDTFRKIIKKKIRPWYKAQAAKMNKDVDNIIFIPACKVTGIACYL
jgi:hypothetical protein